MSDDGMEKFEISDYDLENEFNINRPQRKRTKEQEMLGKLSNSTILYECFSFFYCEAC